MLPEVMSEKERTKNVYLIGDSGAGKTAALNSYLQKNQTEAGKQGDIEMRGGASSALITTTTRKTNIQSHDRTIYGIPFHFQFYDMVGGAVVTEQNHPEPDIILIFFDGANKRALKEVKLKYAKSVVENRFDPKKCVVVSAKADAEKVEKSIQSYTDSVQSKPALWDPQITESRFYGI